MGGLPTPVEAADIWHGIWYEEAHHSTAIEGNTLVLKQVERLLAEGRAVGNKELREYMEVRGYADAADWVYRQQPARTDSHIPKAAALRAAAERGRLRATRGPGGQWRSSRRWVDEYLASRYRRDSTTRRSKES